MYFSVKITFHLTDFEQNWDFRRTGEGLSGTRDFEGPNRDCLGQTGTVGHPTNKVKVINVYLGACIYDGQSVKGDKSFCTFDCFSTSLQHLYWTYISTLIIST